jgi:hypothetical protein
MFDKSGFYLLLVDFHLHHRVVGEKCKSNVLVVLRKRVEVSPYNTDKWIHVVISLILIWSSMILTAL